MNKKGKYEPQMAGFRPPPTRYIFKNMPGKRKVLRPHRDLKVVIDKPKKLVGATKSFYWPRVFW